VAQEQEDAAKGPRCKGSLFARPQAARPGQRVAGVPQQQRPAAGARPSFARQQPQRPQPLSQKLELQQQGGDAAKMQGAAALQRQRQPLRESQPLEPQPTPPRRRLNGGVSAQDIKQVCDSNALGRHGNEL
jgi:hypothetical protein